MQNYLYPAHAKLELCSVAFQLESKPKESELSLDFLTAAVFPIIATMATLRSQIQANLSYAYNFWVFVHQSFQLTKEWVYLKFRDQMGVDTKSYS